MMNSRELLNTVLRMEEAERVPIFLFDLSLGMDALDIPTTDIYSSGYDGKLAGKCVLALQKYLGHDIVAGSYQSTDIRAFGGEMFYPEKGIPYATKAPFKNPDDLYRYRGVDIADYMQGSVDSFSTIRSSRPDLGLMMNIPVPFSMAVMMRGLEPMLMDLLLEPDYCNDVIAFGKDVTLTSIETVMASADMDAVLLTGSSDNLDLLGFDALRNFSYPGLKSAVKFVHDRDVPIMFHPHGGFTNDNDSEKVLDEMMGMGMECFYYGEAIDSVKMKNHAKGKCALCGGVDTFTTIYLGPDERVKKDVSEYMKIHDNNYIFTASCSVDRGLSLNRMKMMTDAVRSYPL